MIRWPKGLEAPRFCLMDYRLHFEDAYVDSFCYILPIESDPDGAKVFVEETILVADDRPFNVIKKRFLRRLRSLGLTEEQVDTREVLWNEEFAIPVGGALPARSGPICIGACARMMHPATGYCFGYTARRVPKLVEAMKAGKSEEEIWDVLHDNRFLSYYFLCFAQLVFCYFTHAKDQENFFRTFFKRPTWKGFMARRLTPSEMVSHNVKFILSMDLGLMLHFFTNVILVLCWAVFASIQGLFL